MVLTIILIPDLIYILLPLSITPNLQPNGIILLLHSSVPI
jgi:hypothetical protein